MARTVDAGRDIRQSVIITGDGSSASLQFGDEFALPLDRRQIPAPRRSRDQAGYNPLPLLAPDANVLPLVGREASLDELGAWLESEGDISVRAVVARAGTGKTRLAIELCKTVDNGFASGTGTWDAGFIRPSDLAAVVDRLRTSRFDWPRPTLLVIDYAAAVHRELSEWLDRLALEPFSGKLRLLLLDREAPAGFGWWHDLTHPTDNRGVTRRDLFVDPDRPQILSDLDPGKGRRALFETALAETAGMMGSRAPGHTVPAMGDDPQFDAALASARFGNPLNLAMAGMIAAERGSVAAIALRRLDAARHLARHDLGRMARIARGEKIDERAMRHVLGFNGLAGGLPLATLGSDIAAELHAAAVPGEAAALADVLMQELPPPGSPSSETSEPRLGTIQPDLIGEAVIIEALLVGAPDRAVRATQVIERAYRLAAKRAAEALMRLIQDYGHALEDPSASAEERDVAGVVMGLLPALADAIPNEEIVSLETLVSALPDSTTVLREAAAAQTQRLVDVWSALLDSLEARGEESLAIFARERLARWLNNLGNRLSDLGRREEALAAARGSIEHWRALTEIDVEESTVFLATALNNVAGRLADLGLREEALAAAQESVDFRRALCESNPAEFAAALASSLVNLANCLAALGKQDAALVPAREAVDLHRALAEDDPEAFEPALAISLTSLSNRLSDMGERTEALASAQESTFLRRNLAAASPDAFTPGLAGSLNNLSNRLAEVGQHEEALALVQESVEFYRALAAARPGAFTPDLAGTLINLASRLSHIGLNEASLSAAQEAASLLRELAVANRAAFAPSLAMALSGLADRLEQNGRMHEALQADRESIAVLAPYFRERPEAFTKPMAVYLRDYVRRTEKAGVEVDSDLAFPIVEALNRLLKPEA